MRQQAVQAHQAASEARHRALAARLVQRMPVANRLTRDITAGIITTHGLLDSRPRSEPLASLRQRVVNACARAAVLRAQAHALCGNAARLMKTGTRAHGLDEDVGELRFAAD